MREISTLVLIIICAVLFSGEPDLLDVIRVSVFSSYVPCEWPAWPVR